MTNPKISSHVGTRLLFENERVKVWDLRLEPGQSTGLHNHEHDYLYVVIDGGTLQGADADGNRRDPNTMEDGHVVFRNIPEGDVHEAINAGEGPWRNIIVELKK